MTTFNPVIPSIPSPATLQDGRDPDEIDGRGGGLFLTPAAAGADPCGPRSLEARSIALLKD